MMNEELFKKTCLYDEHKGLGAKIVPFGGFMMPLQYKGIVKEHEAVRTRCGVFDTCHMGEIKVSGVDAVKDLENLLTCDISGIKLDRCRYGLLCNDKGGTLDDLLVYRMADDEFMLVVNAGTQERDYEWIVNHVSGQTRLNNVSSTIAKIDVQGPNSPLLMEEILEKSISGMKFYSFESNSFGSVEVLVSRTGYTGEIGFEIYFYSNNEAARGFWRKCLELGAEPAGLGARDTLRLEMGMPLYGHELNEERNAGESGFDRPISSEKSFIGSDVVLDEFAKSDMLVGILLDGRKAARAGDEIRDESGAMIGEVTSGSYGPSVGKAIAMGYIKKHCADRGTGIIVNTARQPVSGTVYDMPFYGAGTARKALSCFFER